MEEEIDRIESILGEHDALEEEAETAIKDILITYDNWKIQLPEELCDDRLTFNVKYTQKEFPLKAVSLYKYVSETTGKRSLHIMLEDPDGETFHIRATDWNVFDVLNLIDGVLLQKREQ